MSDDYNQMSTLHRVPMHIGPSDFLVEGVAVQPAGSSPTVMANTPVKAPHGAISADMHVSYDQRGGQ